MTVLEEIGDRIDALWKDGRRPVAVHIGEKQARAIADELNEPWYLQQRMGFTWDNTAHKPVEWQAVTGGTGWLYDIKVVGVESPDYLNVVSLEMTT